MSLRALRGLDKLEPHEDLLGPIRDSVKRLDTYYEFGVRQAFGYEVDFLKYLVDEAMAKWDADAIEVAERQS